MAIVPTNQEKSIGHADETLVSREYEPAVLQSAKYSLCPAH